MKTECTRLYSIETNSMGHITLTQTETGRDILFEGDEATSFEEICFKEGYELKIPEHIFNSFCGEYFT